MTSKDIVYQRLYNQYIARTDHKEPASIISALTAMQAQVFPMAKWAIGLRLQGITEKKIESDFNEGLFLRTHMLRPTWHFVTPEDIQWILKLTAPHVHAFNQYYYHQASFTPLDFKKVMMLFEKSLAGLNFLTRENLQNILEKNKIKAHGLRLGLIFMFAELEGLICSGPRIGKKFTYALMEERIKGRIPRKPKQPLDELTRRYFATRGPATIQDFMWWSGLPAKQAREGLDRLQNKFEKDSFSGKDYIFKPVNKVGQGKIQSCFLLPDYDEYGISYKNREAYKQAGTDQESALIDPGFKHWLIVEGVIGGKWKRVMKNKEWCAEAQCFSTLNKWQRKSVSKALEKFNAFTMGSN